MWGKLSFSCYKLQFLQTLAVNRLKNLKHSGQEPQETLLDLFQCNFIREQVEQLTHYEN